MSRILYYNGKMITLNELQPNADYLLSADGVIAEVGSSYGNIPEGLDFEEAVDLNGKVVIPGFIDSHMHMLTGAFSKMQVDVNDLQFETVEDMVRYIKASAASSDGWIRAAGFTEENIKEGRMPTKADLDAVIRDQPVILTRCCGHLSVVNSAVLDALDKEDMRTIRGGEFQADQNGQFTGIITEAAQQYILDRIPMPPKETILQKLEEEQQALIQKGICSIHDAGTDQVLPHEYIDIYRTFADSGKLKIRTYLMARPEDGEPFEQFVSMMGELKKAYPPETSRLFFGAVKLFADGSIGGRTAAINGSYADEPENHGLLLAERLNRYIKPTHSAALQLSVHAIGDRATEYVADQIIASSENEKETASEDVRHRIEHAELLNEELIQKLKAHNFLIMAQPRFITEFGNTYRKNLGDAAETIQPLRTLMETGIPVGFGTDYPVVDANPMLGIESAVNRTVKNSGVPLNEAERISFIDSLKAYTLMGAYGAFTEKLQGSLENGKFADFVVLDADLDAVKNRSHYDDLSVLRTVIGGEILYERNDGSHENKCRKNDEEPSSGR